MTRRLAKTSKRRAPSRPLSRHADPILVAIADYKHAVALWAADLEVNDENVSKKLDKAQWTAFNALFTTQPTTLVGLAALLELFGTDPYDQGREDCELTLEWALSGEDAARKFVGNAFKALAATVRALDAGMAAKVGASA
jgi:hypothetical protein